MKTHLFPNIHPSLLKTIFTASALLPFSLVLNNYIIAQVRHLFKTLDVVITVIGLTASLIGIPIDGWHIIGLLLRQSAFLDTLWQRFYGNPSPAMAILTLLMSPFAIHSIELGIDLYKIRDYRPWSFVKLIKTGMEFLF
ncbi:MAG: hypothetical protein IPJ74_04530 [Saprospiraceae bacterium]|nr:hypothetical protein [Saprospiraceae bacterium]